MNFRVYLLKMKTRSNLSRSKAIEKERYAIFRDEIVFAQKDVILPKKFDKNAAEKI